MEYPVLHKTHVFYPHTSVGDLSPIHKKNFAGNFVNFPKLHSNLKFGNSIPWGKGIGQSQAQNC